MIRVLLICVCLAAIKRPEDLKLSTAPCARNSPERQSRGMYISASVILFSLARQRQIKVDYILEDMFAASAKPQQREAQPGLTEFTTSAPLNLHSRRKFE